MQKNSFLRLPVGILLLFLGFVSLLSFKATPFCTLVTDYPTHNEEVLALDCPGILDKGETGNFTATLRNLQAHPSGYQLIVNQVSWPRPLNASIGGDPTETHFALASGESKQFNWKVTSESPGRQCFTVTAFSQADMLLPGTFHMWSTSALATCSFAVMDIPGLTGQQVTLLKNVSGITSILIGLGILMAWIARRWQMQP